MAEHLYDSQVVGGSTPSVPTNVSEWYAGRMTVNELINALDTLPADAEVILAGDHDAGVVGDLRSIHLNESGTVVTLGVA